MEHFIESQEEAEQFADLIASIENQQEDQNLYVQMVFKQASQFVSNKFKEKQEKRYNALSDQGNEEEYEKLEVQLQKYEKDVR